MARPMHRKKYRHSTSKRWKRRRLMCRQLLVDKILSIKCDLEKHFTQKMEKGTATKMCSEKNCFKSVELFMSEGIIGRLLKSLKLLLC